MGLRKRFRDFRDWCPQPPDRLPSKLKRYSMPIAAAASVTLILSVSLFVFSSSFMPSASIVPLSVCLLQQLPRLIWNYISSGRVSRRLLLSATSFTSALGMVMFMLCNATKALNCGTAAVVLLPLQTEWLRRHRLFR